MGRKYRVCSRSTANSCSLGSFKLVPNKNREKAIPDWTIVDSCVREVLKAEFPRLNRPPQRGRAGRWALVLTRYYRQQKTSQDIADELGITTGAVKQILVRAKAMGRKLFGDAPQTPLQSIAEVQGNTLEARDE